MISCPISSTFDDSKGCKARQELTRETLRSKIILIYKTNI